MNTERQQQLKAIADHGNRLSSAPSERGQVNSYNSSVGTGLHGEGMYEWRGHVVDGKLYDYNPRAPFGSYQTRLANAYMDKQGYGSALPKGATVNGRPISSVMGGGVQSSSTGSGLSTPTTEIGGSIYRAEGGQTPTPTMASKPLASTGGLGAYRPVDGMASEFSFLSPYMSAITPTFEMGAGIGQLGGLNKTLGLGDDVLPMYQKYYNV